MINLPVFLQDANDANERVILVLGKFELLHPGHIRLFKFSKECGDRLVVGLNANDVTAANKQELNHRIEMINAIDCVDYVFINTLTPVEIINQIKPWAVVKGNEFSQLDNPELEALDTYGGKLIFGSGDFLFSSLPSLFSAQQHAHLDFSALADYRQRHSINHKAINTLLSKTKNLRVLVIGEVIVDEYVQGRAVGMSQEDPTIVMTPIERNLFLGGAAITASHIHSLGAENVHFVSVVGEDDIAGFVKNKCKEYGLHATLFTDYSRPTPLKTRYRVDNKTLLRVNELRQHKISKEIRQSILTKVKVLVDTVDLVVFSDFNYGLLPQALVEDISSICLEKQVMMVADSQTSSQIGDISRYVSMMQVTPTEKEVRVALNNSDDGLVVLADKLYQKSKPEHIAITLGGDGVFIHIPTKSGQWENDQIAALNTNAVDPAGGGDCFFAASSILLAVGANPWEAYYVSSIAAACQVDRVGNRPLDQDLLDDLINQSFI